MTTNVLVLVITFAGRKVTIVAFLFFLWYNCKSYSTFDKEGITLKCVIFVFKVALNKLTWYPFYYKVKTEVSLNNKVLYQDIGKSTILTCNVRGNPLMKTVTWYKNGKRIDMSNIHKYKLDQYRVSMLFFPSVILFI